MGITNDKILGIHKKYSYLVEIFNFRGGGLLVPLLLLAHYQRAPE